MKTLTKTASLLVALIISALFCAAQQTAPSPSARPTAVVANNVQLVIEGKVINVHDGDTDVPATETWQKGIGSSSRVSKKLKRPDISEQGTVRRSN